MARKLTMTILMTLLVFLLAGAHKKEKGETKKYLLDKTETAPPKAFIAPDDSARYSFVVTGDCRTDSNDLKNDPATINLPTFNRILDEVNAIANPKPDFLFLTGDLVMGKTDDTLRLEAELRVFVSHYKNHAISNSGIKMYALPGNHDDSGWNGKPYAAAERVWIRVMNEFIPASNGPGVGTPDNLETDQSKLSVSFDAKNIHFVLLSTEAVGQKCTIPLSWFSNDLKTAHANQAIKHIFVMGHKPASASTYEEKQFVFGPKASKEDRKKYDEFVNVMAENNVEVYFGAHVHTWDKSQSNPGKTWFFIDGNAGAPPDASPSDTLHYKYGYDVITIYPASGRVISRRYGWRIPTPYTAAVPAESNLTRMYDSTEVTWGK